MSSNADDVLAIQNLLAAHAAHYDLRNWEAYRELFTEDAEMHVFGRVYRGRDTIASFSGRRVAGKHHLSVPHIEIDGDTARSSTDQVFFRYPDLAVFSVGVYYDEHVKVDGQWKTSRREIVLHCHHPELTAARKQTSYRSVTIGDELD